MKIVHILNSLNATFALDLIEAFPRTDTITVIALLGSGPSKSRLEGLGVRVVELQSLPGYSRADKFRGLRLGFNLPQLVERVHAELSLLAPDIVHTHLWLSDIVGTRAAKGLHVKLFSTQHDMVNLPFVVKLLKKAALKQVKKVVMISEAVRAFAIPYFGLPASKAVTIYNGIAVQRFAAAVKPNLEWQPIFAVVARLEQVKGHRILFEALARLKKDLVPLPTILIIGSGSQQRQLQQLAEQLGISETLEWRGYQADIVSVLRDIDVLVQPSLSEGLGVTVLEGLAGKKLVIASATGGISEIITDGKTGLLFPVGESAVLAEKIRWVIENRTAAQELRERGHEWFSGQQRFDIKETAEQYRTLYESA